MKKITTEEFKSNILDYTQKPHTYLVKKPTIIKFSAPWCQPCLMMNPILEDVEKKYEGKLDVFNVDVDSEHEPAAAFGISSIPNMIFIPLEGEAERMVGALPKKSVVDAVERLFGL